MCVPPVPEKSSGFCLVSRSRTPPCWMSQHGVVSPTDGVPHEDGRWRERCLSIQQAETTPFSCVGCAFAASFFLFKRALFACARLRHCARVCLRLCVCVCVVCVCVLTLIYIYAHPHEPAFPRLHIAHPCKLALSLPLQPFPICSFATIHVQSFPHSICFLAVLRLPELICSTCSFDAIHFLQKL